MTSTAAQANHTHTPEKRVPAQHTPSRSGVSLPYGLGGANHIWHVVSEPSKIVRSAYGNQQQAGAIRTETQAGHHVPDMIPLGRPYGRETPRPRQLKQPGIPNKGLPLGGLPERRAKNLFSPGPMGSGPESKVEPEPIRVQEAFHVLHESAGFVAAYSLGTQEVVVFGAVEQGCVFGGEAGQFG
ncbi:hypothetical protein EV192_110296 [Actinocrispum wychmicini]|uniref:Uncharacterized protein n=1 Tax=Actinocrispum wychmicini TaxID=1213861 RepID=A0A4R2JAH0_9PSEU|nr:hypothetical protein EV192_110296 [Actinocrispum wychmicini]